MKLIVFSGGNESDVVISSRVRLARNLKNIPFPNKLDKNEQKRVLKIVKEVLIEEGSGYKFVDPLLLSDVDIYSLVEMHLISPEIAREKEGKGIVFNEKDIISIMINEEDHVRIQCLSSGLDIDNTYNKCVKVDSKIEKIAQYAFNEKYGYLTSCPTNIGTGLRVSAMLHLPALMITGHIGNILDSCSKFGITIRGLYGENTKALGNIFQISNQVTLGQTEGDIIINVNNIVTQIIETERQLRLELYNQDRFIFEDKRYRSLGILKNARLLDIGEAFKLISDVKLGVDINVIKEITKEQVNKTMVLMQPACLNKYMKDSNIDNINIMRANFVRNMLSDKNIKK